MLRKEIYIELIVNAIKMVLGVAGVIAVEERKHTYDSIETKKQGEKSKPFFVTYLALNVHVFVSEQKKITFFSTRRSQ